MRSLACLVACALASAAIADVRLPAIIGSNMVLQQRSEVPIWGWDTPGQKVTITPSWLDAPLTVAAGEGGRWMVKVKTPAAGNSPGALIVEGSSKVRLDNILFGEVWVCSGQSNMEMPVGDVGPGYRGAVNSKVELEDARYGGIRLFDVRNTAAAEPREDCTGQWQVCSPATVHGFSATAYFFGRDLHKTLNVPVGLICTSWGGTVCEAWTSEEGLAPFPEFAADVAFVRSQRGSAAAPDWNAAMEAWWAGANEPGVREHWEAPGIDDSSWRLIEVPGAWGGELANFDGVVWLRRPLHIREEWGGKELELRLGPIDDMDAVYLDGQQVGATLAPGSHDKPRTYTIPASLAAAGDRVLAVRVLDTGGPGGIGGGAADSWVGPKGGSERLPLAGYWKYRAGAKMAELPRIQGPRTVHANTPTALYNGMVAPLIPFAIRGAIWYQGESNIGRADQYATLLPAMIGDWRSRWGVGEFPFYYVQIAPFNYGNRGGLVPLLREAQDRVQATPNTGMAVTMDIGNPADIHPNQKQEVGRRLAVLALAKTYGRDGIEWSGPVFKSLKVEGDRAIVSFDHADGLNSRGEKIVGFQVAGAGQPPMFHDAVATIEGNTVVLTCDKVASPAIVRYGWGDAIQPNLFNGVNLPAAPFRSAPWKD